MEQEHRSGLEPTVLAEPVEHPERHVPKPELGEGHEQFGEGELRLPRERRHGPCGFGPLGAVGGVKAHRPGNKLDGAPFDHASGEPGGPLFVARAKVRERQQVAATPPERRPIRRQAGASTPASFVAR